MTATQDYAKVHLSGGGTTNQQEIFEVNDIVREYGDCQHVLLTGSRYICSPPVLDTDIDIVIVYNGSLSHVLQTRGYSLSDHGEYDNHEIRACYRKGNVNIIALSSHEDFKNWTKAHRLAQHLNLKEKHQRVALFQFITEGHVRGTGIMYHDKLTQEVPEVF